MRVSVLKWDMGVPHGLTPPCFLAAPNTGTSPAPSRLRQLVRMTRLTMGLFGQHIQPERVGVPSENHLWASGADGQIIKFLSK